MRDEKDKKVDTLRDASEAGMKRTTINMIQNNDKVQTLRNEGAPEAKSTRSFGDEKPING